MSKMMSKRRLLALGRVTLIGLGFLTIGLMVHPYSAIAMPEGVNGASVSVYFTDYRHNPVRAAADPTRPGSVVYGNDLCRTRCGCVVRMCTPFFEPLDGLTWAKDDDGIVCVDGMVRRGCSTISCVVPARRLYALR